ncbi:hypothetical protein ACIQ7D_18145 [Streptomyces sp. NPDC096310]|uniref:hypothetical protein n=1 Tax=Streptomyces sp. NPDC096310 TaxID=3366082 RepID=UPI00381A5427
MPDIIPSAQPDDTNPTATPSAALLLSPEREQEIRETHPGTWYAGPWTQDYVDSNPDGTEPAYYRLVHHESGTTLATLPDFAGDIALFIADAHEAVPELLAELDRTRAALRAALGAEKDVVEFGVRTEGRDPYITNYGRPRELAEEARDRHLASDRTRESWMGPRLNPTLMQRTVRYGTWTEAS